jgi:hypothetical protein
MGLRFNPTEGEGEYYKNPSALFKIAVPQQTQIGIYTIPLNVTIREPSVPSLTKPISIDTKSR